MSWRIVVGLGLGIAACYRPASYDACMVRCDVTVPCPEGLSCRVGFCTADGDPDCASSTCTLVAPVIVTPVVGATCNAQNATVADGQVAGLDWENSALAAAPNCTGCPTLTPLCPDPCCPCVTSCFQADFGSVQHMEAVHLRVAYSSNACNTFPCMGDFCNTADYVVVFETTGDGDHRLVGEADVANTLAEVVLLLDRPTRHLLICRPASGASRDDLIVDSIAACVQ